MLESITVVGSWLLDGVGWDGQETSLVNDSLGACRVKVSHPGRKECLSLHISSFGLLELVVECSLDRLLLCAGAVLLYQVFSSDRIASGDNAMGNVSECNLVVGVAEATHQRILVSPQVSTKTVSRDNLLHAVVELLFLRAHVSWIKFLSLKILTRTRVLMYLLRNRSFGVLLGRLLIGDFHFIRHLFVSV